MNGQATPLENGVTFITCPQCGSNTCKLDQVIAPPAEPWNGRKKTFSVLGLRLYFECLCGHTFTLTYTLGRHHTVVEVEGAR